MDDKPQPGDWIPNNGPQLAALQSSAFETLYGGARGGGKTDAGLVWMLKPIAIPEYRGLVIRRNADDLSDWVDRAGKMYRSFGADIAYKPPVIRFPSGAVIRCGHLKDDQAYTKYQGHEYQRMLIEELTQIPDEKRYLQLLGSCRSTVEGLPARVFATTNPGGLGHLWVKERFVDPQTPGRVFIIGNERSRIFIPARVEDTPQLVDNDPGYVQFLEGLKNTDIELWKAWRMGDWDTFAGMFFREFSRTVHVIKPFMPGKDNLIVGGMDWGYHAPFSFHLSTVIKVFYNEIPFYRVKTFMEVYGTDKTPREWGAAILDRLRFFDLGLSNISWVQADPATFNKGTDGSIAIRDQFVEYNEGYRILKAGSNDRIPGWANMHQWLSIAPDGQPYWQITENCTNLIKELGAAVYDENRIEDLTAEYDHALDECFVKGTKIDTSKGIINIESVKKGYEILTRDGFRKVLVVHQKTAKPVYEVLFSDGRTLIGTANHPIFIQNKGFVPIDELRYNDRVCTSISYRQPSKNLTGNAITNAAFITKETVKDCILQCWKTIEAKLGVVIISITLIVTEIITNLGTWLGFPLLITSPIMVNYTHRQMNTWQKSDCLQKHGTDHRTDLRGIVNTVKQVGRNEPILAKDVSCVIAGIKRLAQKLLSIVTKTVRRLVDGSDIRVRSVKYHSIQPVYNLMVADKPEYFANGILVHNCRYCLKALKWLDGSVGGVKQNSKDKRETQYFARMDDGLQLSVDPDRFS